MGMMERRVMVMSGLGGADLFRYARYEEDLVNMSKTSYITNSGFSTRSDMNLELSSVVRCDGKFGVWEKEPWWAILTVPQN
jgi:hypothetical protein